MQGTPGAKGEPGKEGKTGRAGARGERGERGTVGKEGPRGERGERGAAGDRGPPGPKGDKGDKGEPGPKGDIGPPPKHRWEGTYLQLQNPDGSWGPLIDLQGRGGTSAYFSEITRADVIALIEEIMAADNDTEYAHLPFSATAAGPTPLLEPPPGQCIRLHGVDALTDPDSETNPLLKFFLGDEEVYRGYALAKRRQKTGAPDAPLIVDLSEAAPVSGTIIYEFVEAE